MKPIFAAGIVMMLGLGNAYGAGTCPTNQNQYLSGSQISTLVSGRTVCAQSASGGWNEEHTGGTTINEWHTNSAGDPKELNVGSYTIQSNVAGQAGTVTYTYAGGGGTYTYFVTNPDPVSGNHVFCTTRGGTGITVNVRSGYLPISGCPSNPDK